MKPLMDQLESNWTEAKEILFGNGGFSLPQTPEEMFSATVMLAVLSMLSAIVAVKIRHRRGPWFAIVLVTPIVWLFVGNVTEYLPWKENFLATLLATASVQWLIAINTIQKPKHMYTEPSDYSNLLD